MTSLRYRWEDVEVEPLNPKLSRKLIAGEKVMLAQVHLKKGAIVPTHAHVHEQLAYVLRGALKFSLAGSEYTLRGGEVLHIRSNEKHGVVALADSLVLDIFSPIREDWLRGDDAYLRDLKASEKQKRKLPAPRK